MGGRKGKDQVESASPDPVAEQLAALRELMPHIFTEGRVDCAKLKEAVGEFAEDGPERYRLTWAGKRDAMRLLQFPSRRPDSGVRR